MKGGTEATQPARTAALRRVGRRVRSLLAAAGLATATMLGLPTLATATVIGRDWASRCVPCGYRLIHPLSDRTVTSSHRITIEVVCRAQRAVNLPQLRLGDGSLLESTWIDQGTGQYGLYDLQITRYERTGPPLPEGASVTLGSSGSQYCWDALTTHDGVNDYDPAGCFELDQAEPCCATVDASMQQFEPLLSFQVEAEGGSVESRDALTDAGKLDGGSQPLDAAPAALDGTRSALDGSDADSAFETGQDSPGALNWSAGSLGLRCSVNGDSADLYLDVGVAPLPDNVVRIDLFDREIADDGATKDTALRWETEPCLGQARRQFKAAGLPNGPGWVAFDTTTTSRRHVYRILAHTEGGPLDETPLRELRVPQDCVESSEIELTWQQLAFTVNCQRAREERDWDEFTELLGRDVDSRACVAELSEPAQGEPAEPIFPEEPPNGQNPALVVTTVSTPSAPPSDAPSPPTFVRSGRSVPSSSCSFRARGYRNPPLFVAMSWLLCLAWRRRKPDALPARSARLLVQRRRGSRTREGIEA